MLVVGGGKVAAQKMKHLLAAGALLRVVSPSLSPAAERLWRRSPDRIVVKRRGFQSQDVKEMHLVIAATDDEVTNRRVFAAGEQAKLWVNVVDVPSLCSFIAPAIVRRGGMQLAISTGGGSPALAKLLRKVLHRQIGPEYLQLLRLIRRYRPAINRLPLPDKRRIWRRLMTESVLRRLRRSGIAAVEEYLREQLNGTHVV
ncbi:MAG: bifunctional precorrin-2 dehydrogenase/sirohydrochlorin ferrochelatase [Elusimicrobia bacterium]|nr:bifunctional precorrin-2 dehydrogenase/sirohydrochlorin ferrochelatase [Elusimicrobiota bacterium]